MQNIEVKVLNPDAIQEAEKMMVAMARLTQRGHSIKNMNDLDALLAKPYSSELAENMCLLPHPTLQKFGVINVAIVGASRRFLAQITRHQNEVKFMSGSLQYSDYSDSAQFVVPYEILKASKESKKVSYEHCCIAEHCYSHILLDPVQAYLGACEEQMAVYKGIASEAGNDAAGYAAPQGLRNILVISATPFQWKHMISQRICRRNTSETMYVMLLIWEALLKQGGNIFKLGVGPSCSTWPWICNEGKMTCGRALCDTEVDVYQAEHNCLLPTAILDINFPLIRS